MQHNEGVWLTLGMLTGGAFGLARKVARFGTQDDAAPADVLIVLGARVYPGGSPSPALLARVQHGVMLYRRGIAPKLLLSGGDGAQAGVREAEVMRQLVREAGVPEAACVLELDSRTTEENARACVPLVRKLGARRCVVVTDTFHLLRARQAFWREGLDVRMSPVPLESRGLSARSLKAWEIREACTLISRPSLLWARRPVLETLKTEA